MTSMHVDLRVGESVKISGPATVMLEEKSGQRARLTIQADPGVKIERTARTSGADQARLGIRPAA